MRNEIIVYCKDEEDIKQTCEYIKELNIFNEGCIYKDQAIFFNYTEDGDIKERIRCVTFRENVRGIRGNIGLLTSSFQEYLKNNKDMYWKIICPSINDSFSYSKEREKEFYRELIAPLSILEKLFKRDITYLLVDDHRDSYDIEYITTDVVFALSYLKKHQRCTFHICRQDNLKCEISTLNIDEVWNYETIVEIISGIKIEK